MKARSQTLQDHETSPQSGNGPATGGRATKWDGAAVFRTTALAFDAGDKVNGSLYLCDPTNGLQRAAVEEAVSVLRARSIWSAQEVKQVRDDQRQAYEEQLVFVEAVEFPIGGARLVMVRCDHPKFPSSSERFAAWKIALGVG